MSLSGRTYEEQKADILAGWNILQQELSAVRIFTPPWHGYDQNTLTALGDCHFQGISTDHKSRVLSRTQHLNNTFVSVYVNKCSASGWFVERPACYYVMSRLLLEQHPGFYCIINLLTIKMSLRILICS